MSLRPPFAALVFVVINHTTGGGFLLTTKNPAVWRGISTGKRGRREKPRVTQKEF
jgi:hypothetical protein